LRSGRTAIPSEARVAPEALPQIKRGDNVTIDLTIAAPGVPAASPAPR
jgi:hypothetical protein